MKIKVALIVASLFLTTMTFGEVDHRMKRLAEEALFLRQIPDLSKIKWRIGDFQNRELFRGNLRGGTLKTWIDREEGRAVWILSELKIVFQRKQFIEILLDRRTGEILKYIVDGKEEEPPSVADLDDCKALQQAKVRITVPAGEFVTDRTILQCDEDYFGVYEASGVNMGGFVKLTVLDEDLKITSPDYTVNLTEFGTN